MGDDVPPSIKYDNRQQLSNYRLLITNIQYPITNMLDQLHARFAACLSERQVCILSTAASSGSWALPVRYRRVSDGDDRRLELDCLLPRWADATYNLEQDARVVLVILTACDPPLGWLQVRGTARPLATPNWKRLLPEAAARDWPESRYCVLRVTPSRLDLIDESKGWGARETLEVG